MKYIIIGLGLGFMIEVLQAQEHPWKLRPTHAYLPIEPFSEGAAVVQKKKASFYMTKEGLFSKDSFKTAGSIFNGLSAVCLSEQKWAYRRKDGSLLSGIYQNAFDFNEGVAVVQNGGQWGVIDEHGAWKLQNYEALRPFSAQWAGAKKEEKTLITNLLGNEIYVDYDYIGTFSEGLVQVSNRKGDCGYINIHGEEVIKIVKGRKYVTDFFNGLAAVCDTFPHLTYLDRQGKTIFWIKDGMKYQPSAQSAPIGMGIYQHSFKNGFAPIFQKGKWGFIDTNGKIVIPCIYRKVTPFSEGFAAVQEWNGYWRFIDVDHITIQSGAFLEAKPCTEGVAWVRTANGWGLLNIPPHIEIQWASPRKTKQNKATLHCKSSSPIDSIEVVCDGKIQMIQLNQNPIFDKKIAIPLKIGKMLIECTVWAGKKDEKRMKSKSDAVYYYQPPPKGTPVPYSAVFIANKTYDTDKTDTWKSLDYPILDADSLGDMLYYQYQFGLIEVYHNANLAQMDSIMSDLSHHEARDRVLLYYTGHGDQTQVPEGTPKLPNYLIPVDGIGYDRKTQISANKVADYVNKCPSEHFLFIADACFAGEFATASVKVVSEETFGSNGKEKGASVHEKTEERQPIPLHKSEKTPSCQAMTSGHNNVTVTDESIFLRYLCRALADNQTALLPAQTLLNLFKQKAIDESPKELLPQIAPLRGHKKHQGGDFIFRKKRN